MLRNNVLCRFPAHLFIIGICLAMSSCTPQKRPEVPKSEVNNSAVRKTLESSIHLFIDYLRKTGSTEVMGRSITLITPFVTIGPIEEWKTDAERMVQLSDDLLKKADTQMNSPYETATITCSSWFDSFLLGDQPKITVKEDDGKKDYLLQFKICESPKKPEIQSIGGRFMTFLKNCAGFVTKPNVTTWMMFRTPRIEVHALTMSRPHLQECTAWSRGIDNRSLMGVDVKYSYMRKCRLRCDPTYPEQILKANGGLCVASKVDWDEFAEYPDPQLAERQNAQGAASCTLEPVKP